VFTKTQDRSSQPYSYKTALRKNCSQFADGCYELRRGEHTRQKELPKTDKRQKEQRKRKVHLNFDEGLLRGGVPDTVSPFVPCKPHRLYI